MGNKLGRRRQVVDDKYTRPQGLYQHKDVDHKKLRKLILESKLAPCYLGDDDCSNDLEECPICFLYYPSLNRSRCCMKSICTECFLQMKTPNSARPTQCPFCKTANYAVEYRGTKTKEEKGLEQLEEQRVIEAQIRMRQHELHLEEARTHERQEFASSSHAEMSDNGPNDVADPPSNEEVISTHHMPSVTSRSLVQSRHARDDEFDVDLEDIMVMEAIWLSIQENGRHRNNNFDDPTSEQCTRPDLYVSPVMAPLAESSSPSSGLACAIAALAERQQVVGEPSTYYNSNALAAQERTVSNMAEHDTTFYPLPELPAPSARRDDGDWSVDPGSEVAEAGTSYCSSEIAADDIGGFNSSILPQDEVMGRFPNFSGTVIVPETYEEQMMLAMAVSLADARPMTSSQGVVWH